MNEPADLARGWFRKADNDLRTARLILEAGGPFDTGCFHCQQAIEKWLKGYLALHRRDFPFTHDLEVLARLCQTVSPSLELPSPLLPELSDYAVNARYEFTPDPTQEDLREALGEAERLRCVILGAAKLDLGA